MFHRRDLFVAVLAFTLGSTTAVAAASQFVGADGVIHACVTDVGALRLVVAGTECKSSPSAQQNETAISWSQSGGVGPAGPTGATGATGPAGTFSGTFTSPNGQYTLSVTDAGIVISGASSSVITIDGTGTHIDAKNIDLKSDQNTTIDAGQNFTVKASSNVQIRASGTGDLESAGTMTIKGSTVNIN